MSAALLELTDICVDRALAGVTLRPRRLRVVERVSLRLDAGETLGIVGESGCGKSTLVHAIVGLVECAAGGMRLGAESLSADGRRSAAFRRSVQMVFQSPADSLDPRLGVADVLREPLRALAPGLSAHDADARVAAALAAVGLGAELADRRSTQLSLGQCQRVGIARALIVGPALLICDEPVSSLDVSIQAQILNLLAELQRERGLAMLFISHDLAVVRLLCARILVMYLGRVMEQGPRERLLQRPAHPYTQALLAARIEPGDDAPQALRGEPPSIFAPPSGCVFRTRCPHARALCAEREPPLEDAGDGRRVACHYWRELGNEASG